MTEQELIVFRLKAQIYAYEMVLEAALSSLERASPIALAEFQEKANLQREHIQRIYLQNVDPAYSDLATAEFQQAFESVLSLINSKRG